MPVEAGRYFCDDSIPRVAVDLPSYEEWDDLTMERFFSKVEVNPETFCWIWSAGTTQDGYGLFRLPSRQSGCMRRAHRLSYALFKGKVGGHTVLHQCDNPRCVNPHHLSLGSQRDNIADMVRKGRNRGAVGTRNTNAKLDRTSVCRIRVLYAYGYLQKKIAESFRVSQSVVSSVVLGKTWGHVKGLV